MPVGSPNAEKPDIANSSSDIFALGHAIVDVEYRVSDALLQSLGYEKGARYRLDEGPFQIMHAALQAPGAEAEWVAQAGGGSAANTLVTAQRLGARCHFAAKLARDAAGWFYQQTLQQEGLKLSDTPLAEGISGHCLVLVTPDAERTMLLHAGVTEHLAIEDVDLEALQGARYLFLESYLTTTPTARATAQQAILCAQEAQIPIALSLSDVGVIQRYRGELAQWLRQPISLLLGNEAEALAWTEAENLDQALERLAEQAEQVVITRGADGAEVLGQGSRLRVPAPQVQPISALGAGDTFAGALLYGLITAEWPLPQAVAFACACASRKVEFTGARLAREQLLWVRSQGGFADLPRC